MRKISSIVISGFLCSTMLLPAVPASAASCAPTQSNFVGVGTADIEDPAYGNLDEHYTQLVFDAVGACTWTVPYGVSTVDLVLVGGGGAGHWGTRAGGGGAGELAYGTSISLGSATITVTVGVGGNYISSSDYSEAPGGASQFGSFPALGGGHGAGDNTGAITGGSSGGARGFSGESTSPAATTSAADGLTRLANKGGNTDGNAHGAGGGGAGGAAQDVTHYTDTPGTTQPYGGDGFRILGFDLAAGGGGWVNGGQSLGGKADPAGDVIGGSFNATGFDSFGAPNTGSGGATGADGGSGVVIVRFLTPPPPPYMGPIVSGVSKSVLNPCESDMVVLSGTRLGDVTSASIQDASLRLIEVTQTRIEAEVPAGLTSAQGVDLVLISSSGRLTVQDAFDVRDEVCSLEAGELASWTKRLSDSEVKVYAKNLVDAGKLQFFLNGEEVAWVRASSESDPKLRQANGSYYLVRTIELVAGQKNVIEIHVDGERLRRVAYSR